MSQLLSHLNPVQREAVEHTHGPLLILSGAGSGKTRVITHRMAHLMELGLASPEEILCVTFTNKAAREMQKRISQLLGAEDIQLPWVSTFHSFCVRLLRRYIDLLDYSPVFSIYDSADQLTMIKKVLSDLKLDDRSSPAKAIQSRINSAKTMGLSPEEAAKSRLFFDRTTLDVFEKYEADMKRANALDFNDLLIKTYEILQSYPAILEQLQKKFKFIMVDEYQDTNRMQYLIVKALAQEHQNIAVVGDEDQSIYSWRGADIGNILDFEKDFPGAKVIKLETNYRSSQTIVKAASHVIQNNTQRKEKSIHALKEDGDPVIVREEDTEYDEARFVVRTAHSLISSGEYSPGDVAIFYRTNAQSRVFEEQCRAMSLPYKIYGGLRFYDRMEIKDIVGYLKLIINPGDDVAFKRVINAPSRGLGKVTLQRIEELAFQRTVKLVEAAALCVEEKVVHTGAQKKLAGFLDLITLLREKESSLSLPELYHEVIQQTGYVTALQAEGTEEAESRIQNLEELDNAIYQFVQERQEEATLQNFLEEMALLSDLDQSVPEDETVTLMTLHLSKGLEFPIVFMVGMEEGLFPSHRSIESTEPEKIEEERRVCYVGMTRAEEKLFMTYARRRKVWGQQQYHTPSRFLEELPKEGVVFQTSMARPRFVSHQRGRPQSTSFDPVDDFQDFPDYDELAETIASNAQWHRGQRVRHPTYGEGSILQVEGQGEKTRVTVQFRGASVKKFVAKFAKLENLSF